MRVKQIEDLPMATSAELYQLSWVIEQLMADPRRIVQARSQLHMGQLVKYWDWGTGKLREARIAAMKDRQVTLLDEQSKQRLSVLYAAVVPVDDQQASASPSPAPAAPLRPPPEIHHKQDFRVGQRVSFTDQSLKRHVGEIVRITSARPPSTATAAHGAWRSLCFNTSPTSSLKPSGRQQRPRADYYLLSHPAKGVPANPMSVDVRWREVG